MRGLLHALTILTVTIAVTFGSVMHQVFVACSMAESGMHCCCDHDNEQPGPVVLAAEDACCDIQVVENRIHTVPGPELAQDAPALVLAWPVSALTWPESPIRPSENPVAAPRGPPKKPPLYIENCSLLI